MLLCTSVSGKLPIGGVGLGRLTLYSAILIYTPDSDMVTS